MAEENHMNQGSATSPHTGEEKSREQTGQAPEQPQNVQSSRRRREDKTRMAAERISGGEVLDDAKQRLRTLKEDTDEYVRRNPAKAVFTALGIGFVLGLMRRRH